MTHRRLNVRIGRLLLAVARFTKLAALIGMAILGGPQSRAQSTAQATATAGFEVASVRLDKAGGDRRSLVFSPNGITFTNVTLRDCIRSAYAVGVSVRSCR